MLETLKNAWKIPELRKKIIFTLFILLIYRAGNVIPVPYIDTATLTNYFDSVLSSTILGLYNAMSGSAFSRAPIFALSIQPYINASIIIQLLTIAIPALERMAKEEGEEGQKKIARITRYTTVALGLLMGACELIPYVGPLIGGVPIVLFALPMGLPATLWALGVTIAVQQLEGYFLSPRLMAGATGLHPVYVMLLLSAGGLLGGLAGMILALPAFVCLRGAFRVLRG